MAPNELAIWLELTNTSVTGIGAQQSSMSDGISDVPQHLVTTTWNPHNHGQDIHFSNGNLTVTKVLTDGLSSGVCTTDIITELAYVEWLIQTMASNASFAVGIATPAFNVDSFLGVSAPPGSSIGYYGNGQVVGNQAVLATLATYAPGDVIGLAFNGSNGNGWFSKNGVFSIGNPATDTDPQFTFSGTPTLFAAYTLQKGIGSGDKLTGVFRAPFTTPPPAGFSAWDDVA